MLGATDKSADIRITQTSSSQWTLEVGELGDKKIYHINGVWLKDKDGDIDLIQEAARSASSSSGLSEEKKRFCLMRIANIVKEISSQELSQKSEENSSDNAIYQINYHSGSDESMSESIPRNIEVFKGSVKSSELTKTNVRPEKILPELEGLITLLVPDFGREGLTIIDERLASDREENIIFLDQLATKLVEETFGTPSILHRTDTIKTLLAKRLEELINGGDKEFKNKYNALDRNELTSGDALMADSPAIENIYRKIAIEVIKRRVEESKGE